MIKNGKVVSLAYVLKDTAGQVLDQATAADPFLYIAGVGQIVPGLEGALMDLKVGDKKNVEVSPEDGYGEKNPGLELSVARTQFPADQKLEAGMQFQAQSPEGHGMVFTIIGIEGDQVKIDGNHPMAGQKLFFAVEVLDIRDATADEMAHGHAHGPDGHHHH